MSTPTTFDIFLDFSCPWCYIGQHRIVSAAQASGSDPSEITYRAFQLNPSLPDEGIARETYRINKFGSIEESRRRDAIVVNAAEAAGLTINFDLITRTPNTRRAHRVVKIAAGQIPDVSVLGLRIFTAYFCEGRDIGATATLVDLAAEVGVNLTADQLDDNTSNIDKAIDADIEAARHAGLTGVPFVVARKESESVPVSLEVAVHALGEAR